MIGNLCNPPTAKGFHRDKHIACPGASVFKAPTRRRSRQHRQARATVMQRLLVLLVCADHGFVRAAGLRVKILRVVYPLPVLLRQHAYAPHRFP